MKQQHKDRISLGLRRHHSAKRVRSKLRLIITSLQLFLILFIAAHAVKLYAYLEDINTVEYQDTTYPTPDVYEVMEGNEYAPLMAEIAEKYDVSYDTMQKVVECESKFDTETQSYHYFDDGTRENSWGLSQIYLDVWLDVTREQATDPQFALEFMAEKLSEDKGYLWTCYRLLKKNGEI